MKLQHQESRAGGCSVAQSHNLPRLALSVRQPWAWAIIYAGKDIENRSWQAVNHGLNVRGRIAVHAAKGMTRDEFEDAAEFMATLGVKCPAPHLLDRGGIIGSVDVTGVVTAHDSPWFFGPRGLVLCRPEPCVLIPARGALGYFEWKKGYPHELPLPSRWMLPPELQPAKGKPGSAVTAGTGPDAQGSLF